MKPVASRRVRTAATAALAPALLLGALSLASCGSSSNAARRFFVYTKTCPSGQVKQVRRRDIVPHPIVPHDAPPPPEVSADPARLRVWQEARADERKAAYVEACDVFELTGCGQRALYCCAAHLVSNSEEFMHTDAYCYGVDDTGGLSTWSKPVR